MCRAVSHVSVGWHPLEVSVMKEQASVSASRESQDRGVTSAGLASGTTPSMVVKVLWPYVCSMYVLVAEHIRHKS